MFSCIWNEYGGLLCKSLNSVQVWKNTDQKKSHIYILFTLCAPLILWGFIVTMEERFIFIIESSYTSNNASTWS